MAFPYTDDVAGAGGEAAVARELDARLIDIAYRNMGMGLVYHLAAVVGVAALVIGGGPATPIVCWALSALLVIGIRAVLWLAYRRAAPSPGNRSPWIQRFFLTSLMQAMVWSAMTALMVQAPEGALKFFLLAMILVLAADGMTWASAHRPTLLAYFPVIGLPAAILFGLQPGPMSQNIAVTFLLYTALLVALSLRHHDTLRKVLALTAEKERMVVNLSASRDAADRANRAKSTFLANMSHELRTPLNAILGFSEMLRAGPAEMQSLSRTREYSDMIHQSGRHLLGLIEGVLDLSKVEAGAMTVQDSVFALGPVASDCLRTVGPMAEANGVTLEAELDAAPCLRADERKMRQILLNLLSNAIKFSDRGARVRIAAERLETEGVDGGGCRITVSDTGIGMTHEQAEAALQPFVQVSEGYNKAYSGTGLGLPLVQALVRLHGGELEIDSAPGRGTSIAVRLPEARVADDSAPVVPSAPAAVSEPETVSEPEAISESVAPGL